MTAPGGHEQTHLAGCVPGIARGVAGREQERVAAERAAAVQQAEATRRFADEVEALRQRFMEMFSMADPHQRGYVFQNFLDKLFVLFDMEPRMAYSVEHEQIDGSLSFDTDDYIVEARWRKERPIRPTQTTSRRRSGSKARTRSGSS